MLYCKLLLISIDKCMNDFLAFTSQFKWTYEYTLSNKEESVWKVLFCFAENQPDQIQQYFQNHDICTQELESIIDEFWKKINHIGYDEHKNIHKFYIGLYHTSFYNGLKVIQKCKQILKEKREYFLNKDFLQFDCIWFNVSKDWISMKIYELVTLDQNVPELRWMNHIKERWFLKDFSWRSKQFVRFSPELELLEFTKEFVLSDVLLSERNYQHKVKYYCFEWERKELYFY